MDKETFLQQIHAIRKGAFVRIIYRSFPKPCANFKNVKVEKITTSVVRLGVNYEHLKEIKAVRTSGEQSQGLPYGKWVEGLENILIDNNGDLQVRITQSKNRFHHSKPKWYVEGVELNSQDVHSGGIMPEGYWNKKPSPIFNIKLENLIAIKTKGGK